MGDIARARSPGATRKSVAAAATVRLRTSPMIEIVFIGCVLLLGARTLDASSGTHATARSISSLLAAFVFEIKLESVK